jgi:hypothetical protein
VTEATALSTPAGLQSGAADANGAAKPASAIPPTMLPMQARVKRRV